MKKDNVIVDKSFAFAVRVVKLYKYLCDEKKEFILSKQLLRSGTSIGANETFAHSSILLLFCGEVVFLYVEPKTKVKESVSLYKGFRGFCKNYQKLMFY